MPRETSHPRPYDSQRPRKSPPQVGLGDLRIAVGLTLDQLIDRLREQTGRRYGRGTISAIENGHRGPSAELLQALCAVYGLRAGAIETDYHPRKRAD